VFFLKKEPKTLALRGCTVVYCFFLENEPKALAHGLNGSSIG
jgi:hypothetical protein